MKTNWMRNRAELRDRVVHTNDQVFGQILNQVWRQPWRLVWDYIAERISNED